MSRPAVCRSFPVNMPELCLYLLIAMAERCPMSKLIRAMGSCSAIRVVFSLNYSSFMTISPLFIWLMTSSIRSGMSWGNASPTTDLKFSMSDRRQ